VLQELSKVGRVNMLDCMRVGPQGDPVVDFSKLTRDQAAGVIEVTVDDFLDGRGENPARSVELDSSSPISLRRFTGSANTTNCGSTASSTSALASPAGSVRKESRPGRH
jgi:hypothetical protein